MRVVVLGATGGIGRELVRQAADGGDEVVAVLRDAARSVSDPRVTTVVVGDVGDADALTPALRDADAVLSAVGLRGGADGGVQERGAVATVAAMRAEGVRRLLCVSAAPVASMRAPDHPHPSRDPGDDLPTRLLMPLLGRVFAASYADSARMEAVVRGSGLDWTIVRPPRLLDGPATGRARTALDENVRGGRSVRRADVAAVMLRAVSDAGTFGHALGVAD